MRNEIPLNVAVLGRDGECPPFNTAVFASGTNLILVHLEADSHESAAADASARGFQFIGSIGVNGGVPKVECEPVPYAVLMMPYAGVVFAEILGEHMKRQPAELDPRL